MKLGLEFKNHNHNLNPNKKNHKQINITNIYLQLKMNTWKSKLLYIHQKWKLRESKRETESNGKPFWSDW